MRYRRFLAAVMAAVVSTGAATAFNAGAASDSAAKLGLGFEYRIFGDHAVITKCKNVTAKSITVPETLGGLPVKGIGTEAITNFNDLESLTIPEGVTTLSSLAIGGCPKLRTIDLPKSLTDIGSGNFMLTPWLDNQIKAGKTVVVNGTMIDCDCVDKTSFDIPKGVKTVGSGAFSRKYTDKFDSVTISDTVLRLDQMSMAYLADGTEITIPIGVIYIEGRAFGDNPNITIKGYRGSRAERYAKANGIPFTPIGWSTPGLFSYGDVNKDGMVNASDASIVLEEYAGTSTGDIATFDTLECAAADVNSDGYINSADASVILEYYSYASTGGEATMWTWLRER